MVGLLIRHWNEKSALEWNETAKKISGPAFLAVVVLALLGSWRIIIDLIGDRVMLAGLIYPAVMIVLGYFISTGNHPTRAATSMIQAGSNSGPAFAAVAIAFNNDPEILGVLTVLIFLQIAVAAPVGTWMGSKFAGEVEGVDEAGGAEAGGAESPAEAGAGA